MHYLCNMKQIISAILSLCLALPALAAPDYYLTGSFNDWKPNLSAYKFSQDGDIYTLHLESLSGDFKITTSAWEHQYGCDTPIEYGRTYRCIESGNAYNMTLAVGTGKNLTITFDGKYKTIKIEGEINLYLVGDFNGWIVSPAYLFQKEEGLYVLRTRNFSGAFKVVSSDSSVSLGIGGKVPRDTEMNLEHFGAEMRFDGIADSSQKIKITVNPDSDLSVVGTLPVEEAAGTPVYYNLNGLKVENPSKGIYIRRTGSITEKVIIR